MTSLNLKGKVAIVTGAGGGIGREIALALASEGVKILVNDVEYHYQEKEALCYLQKKHVDLLSRKVVKQYQIIIVSLPGLLQKKL